MEGTEWVIEGVEKVNSQTSRWPVALESKEEGRDRPHGALPISESPPATSHALSIWLCQAACKLSVVAFGI